MIDLSRSAPDRPVREMVDVSQKFRCITIEFVYLTSPKTATPLFDLSYLVGFFVLSQNCRNEH